APIDQRAPVKARINARRRGRAVFHPGVERVEQRPQQWPVVAGIVQVVGEAAGWWVAGRSMLGAAEGVDADVGRQSGILRAERVGVGDRAAAVPVLCGALRVHHLRQELVILGRGAPLDAVGSLREWVHGLAVSEREAVAGIEVLLVLAVVTRRLGEAVVEEA